jgi:preprotein translocase subunit YajC
MSELDYKPTEIVLFIGGALLTVTVLVVAVLLYRMASREQREQEKKERGE